MATIREVARRARVSTATVSRALNRAADVSEVARSRVVAAAEALNYAPDRSARNLRRRRDGRSELTYTIGVLQAYEGALKNDLWGADIFASIGSALRRRGYGIRLIVASSRGDIPHEVESGEVDGVILMGGGPVVKKISARVPTVTIDSYDPDLGAYGLVPDYRSGVREVVGRLLAAGVRRVALTCGEIRRLAGSPGTGFIEQTIAGCVDAFDAAGLPLPAGISSADLLMTPDGGYEYGRRILADAKERPEAVLGSDSALLGVCRAAWELGLRIPDDLSLIGTDGVSLGAYFTPPLTTVDAGIDALGEKATEIVVEGAARGEIRRGMELMPTTVVVRASARLAPEGRGE